MSTVNNRNKKYWVRYNPNADRLETEITTGGKKPQSGRGWMTVDIDKCCNTAELENCGTLTFEEELSFSEGCSNVAELYLNGEIIGGGVEQINGNPEDEGGIIDQLNTLYEDVATFTYDPVTFIVTITILVSSSELFTFESASNCE